MSAARVLVILLVVLCLGRAQETTTYIGHYLERFPGPQVYKDPTSGTLFYVETDGRHVVAISSEGKLLWSKDPSKTRICRFTARKSRRLFSSVQP